MITTTDPNKLILNNQLVTLERPLSYPRALFELLKFSTPYVISRVTIALPWFSDGFIFKRLGDDAILAAPYITTIKACVMGLNNAAMMPVAFLAGPYVKKGELFLRDGDREQSNSNLKMVGRISRQSWILAIPFTTISAISLYFSSKLLELTQPSLSPNVIQNVRNFFLTFLISILPSMFVSSDKQLALAFLKPYVPAISSFAQMGLALGIGYPLSIYTDLGIKGIGIGTVASALITLIALRLYFTRQPYNRCELFRYSNGVKEGFSEFISQALALMFFSATEWVNMVIIVAFANRLGTNALLGSQVSLELIIPFSFAIYAFAQATGVFISHFNGTLEKATKENNYELQIITIQNIRKIGIVHITFSVLLGGLVGGFTALFSESFTKLFINKNIDGAKDLLLINCLGVLFDSIRVLASGNLRGLKDTKFTPIVSSIFILVIGLSISAGMIYLSPEASDTWLFSPRVAGLCISAGLIVARWFYMSTHNTLSLLGENKPLLANVEQPLRAPVDHHSSISKRSRFFAESLEGQGASINVDDEQIQKRLE